MKSRNIITIGLLILCAVLYCGLWLHSEAKQELQYATELPDDITLLDDLNFSYASIYLMCSDEHSNYITEATVKRDVSFSEILEYIRGKEITRLPHGYYPALVGTDVNLIGIDGGTLYIEVSWQPQYNLPLTQNVLYTEGLECDLLTLTLTSIPGIDQIQFLRKTGKYVGYLGKELDTPRNKSNLFLVDGYKVEIGN